MACRSIIGSVVCCAVCTSIVSKLKRGTTTVLGQQSAAAVANANEAAEEGRQAQQLRRRQLRVGRCESAPAGDGEGTMLDSSAFFIPLVSCSLSVPRHSDRSPASSVVSSSTTSVATTSTIEPPSNQQQQHQNQHSVHSAAVFGLSPVSSSCEAHSLHDTEPLQPDHTVTGLVGHVPVVPQLAHDSARKFCFSFLRSL